MKHSPCPHWVVYADRVTGFIYHFLISLLPPGFHKKAGTGKLAPHRRARCAVSAGLPPVLSLPILSPRILNAGYVARCAGRKAALRIFTTHLTRVCLFKLQKGEVRCGLV